VLQSHTSCRGTHSAKIILPILS